MSPGRLRLAVIVIPWTIAALYLIFFAADRYVSESIIAVRSNSETPTIVSGLASLFPSAAGSVRTDGLTMMSFIQSGDMLDALEGKLALRKAFEAPKWDYWYRLSRDASRDRLLEYYHDRIEVVIDDDSDLITLRTEGFSPDFSAKLNEAILAIGEQYINDTSRNIARDQMTFSATELDKAQAALEKAQTAVQAFQNRTGVLDPMAQAQANTGVTVDLQSSLTRQEADLKGMLGYLNEAAPQVRSLRQQIDATRSQLEIESRRGTARGAQLNVMATDYQMLLMRLQFSQDAYRAATAAVEGSRIESVRKLKTLVRVESPAVPQRAEMPRRAYTLLSLLLALSLIYGIVRLAVATIEDHLA